MMTVTIIPLSAAQLEVQYSTELRSASHPTRALSLPHLQQRLRHYEPVNTCWWWCCCCDCCFAAPKGYLKVSVRSGVPLTEEDLAELAFQGKGSPSPVGYVRVPKADLQGLERRWVGVCF